MKPFIIGFIVGLIAYGAFDVVSTDRVAPAIESRREQAHAPTPLTTAETDHSDAMSQVRSSTAAADCVSVSDANLDEAIGELITRKQRLEQQDLDAEPKDPLWSDATEQQLREFTARHASAKQFSISRLDCRTLYCVLSVDTPTTELDGRAGSSQADFYKVTEDIEKQLGLMRGATSGNTQGGTYRLETRFRRFKPHDQCPPNFRKDCWNR